MGSFSKKCAVSNLPITAGDDTVLLLGQIFTGHKGVDTGGYIMQNHFFNLIAPPIFGKYNDYGWIEDTEPDSLKFAKEAIVLRGELKSSRRSEEIVDIEEEGVHWSHFEEQVSKLVPDYDYTFIQRPIWDSLVEASSGNYQEGYFFYSEESDLDKAVKSNAEKYNLKLNQYHAYGYPADHFNLALALWQTDLVKRKAKKTKLEQTREEYLEQLLDELESMSSGNSPAKSLSRKLMGFFGELDVDAVDNFIKLMNTPQRTNAMIQTQSFYNALIKGGIVVRGNKEIASEEQCGGAYWPHVAMYKGMRAAMLNEHANVVDYEPDFYAGKVMTQEERLEDLSNRGLREGYDLD